MLPTCAFEITCAIVSSIRVDAERQAVAGRADLLQQLVELAAAVTHHVQYRAEHLALQLVDAADLDQRRRHERAVRAGIGHRQLRDAMALVLHRRDVSIDRLRFGVDHRADVGRQPVGIAERQLASRP